MVEKHARKIRGRRSVYRNRSETGYRFTSPVEITKPEEETIIVEKQTVRHFRGEEIITIEDDAPEKAESQKISPQNVALSSRRASFYKVFFPVAVLVLLAFAGIAASLYRSDAKIGAMFSAASGEAETNIEKIEIDAARAEINSGIKIQRGDLIAFSVAGEFRYAEDQIWTFAGDQNAADAKGYFFENAAPWSLVGWIGTETDRSRYFQVSKIHSLTADRNGTLYFAVNKPRNDYVKNSGTLAADVSISRGAENERQPIKIGSIVNLQNRYPNVGGYLDAWGTVFDKPEFRNITTETKFVSTHYNPNRDNGSGSWEIVSAIGKSGGEPLVVGDRIHLRNKFPAAGYLDACGWIEHMPVFEDFKDQTGAIFTAESPNRDYGTGTWIVRSATEADGSPVLEGDSIALENGFIVVVKGRVFKGGFLNVAGSVRDIPVFNDYDGAGLVFSLDRPSDQPVIDIWTITRSRAISK